MQNCAYEGTPTEDFQHFLEKVSLSKTFILGRKVKRNHRHLRPLGEKHREITGKRALSAVGGNGNRNYLSLSCSATAPLAVSLHTRSTLCSGNVFHRPRLILDSGKTL